MGHWFAFDFVFEQIKKSDRYWHDLKTHIFLRTLKWLSDPQQNIKKESFNLPTNHLFYSKTYLYKNLRVVGQVVPLLKLFQNAESHIPRRTFVGVSFKK